MTKTSETRNKVCRRGDKCGLAARLSLLMAGLLLAGSSPASATDWFVTPGESGRGSQAAPFGRIQDALEAAQPGDVIVLNPGSYAETIRSVRSGTEQRPIRVQAAGARGSVLVTFRGTALRVDHEYLVIERLTFDGQYGGSDTVRVGSGANHLTLRDCEVRRSGVDLIDIASPRAVLIDGCLIHHALNATGGRQDAHGIAAGAVEDLLVRNTEIHTFSGDGLQVDPGRSVQGWRVAIEGCRIWLAPLRAPENGFPAGTVPGENAVDTKVNPLAPRASLLIRDTVASGFERGLITNMAAFNIKEKVDALIDRVTVYDSEIAFRLRGAGTSRSGAWVRVQNAVVYDSATAFRYEDDIEKLLIWNVTIGSGVDRAFRAASSSSKGLEVRNTLVLGPLPSEAAHQSNWSVGATAFVNAMGHDYSLVPNAPAIDRGLRLAGVTTDRVGVARPQGAAFDIGAFER